MRINKKHGIFMISVDYTESHPVRIVAKGFMRHYDNLDDAILSLILEFGEDVYYKVS